MDLIDLKIGKLYAFDLGPSRSAWSNEVYERFHEKLIMYLGYDKGQQALASGLAWKFLMGDEIIFLHNRDIARYIVRATPD